GSGQAWRTASPVPRGGDWIAVLAGATARTTCSIPGPSTTTVSAGSSDRDACRTWRIIGRPAVSCKTFGIAELRRVRSPAARIMAAKRASFMIRLAQRLTGNETRSLGEGLHDPSPTANTQIVADYNCGRASSFG